MEVYFEKEGIWTLDSAGELLITVLSSISQEEARSISENTTWGQRKHSADGKVSVAFSRFLGYDRGEDGNLVVNPEQAVTVKRKTHLQTFPFRAFLYGCRQGINKQENKDSGGKRQVVSGYSSEHFDQ